MDEQRDSNDRRPGFGTLRQIFNRGQYDLTMIKFDALQNGE